MIILLLVALALVLIVHTFVQSAIVLLPWTVTAGCLAALLAVGVGRQLSRSELYRDAASWVTFALTGLLTMALGYLGWLLAPPKAPAETRRSGWEMLLELPDVKMDDLWSMFPIHLAIVALLAAAVATTIYQRVYSADPIDDQGIHFLDGKR